MAFTDHLKCLSLNFVFYKMGTIIPALPTSQTWSKQNKGETTYEPGLVLMLQATIVCMVQMRNFVCQVWTLRKGCTYVCEYLKGFLKNLQ